ncbi:choice-of-anchor Q domain-containing protein [Streptomyces sp. cmx-4-9]|uniref:choice-of-anchor Q domain-containing protein n=1 Tax=Streptomyces sp. cmx-4-9 TaxID=2790941 RepID=UPI00397FF6F2
MEQDRSTGAPSHHIEVTGNEVHDCAGGGISAIDSDHVTISGNHVFGTSWYAVYATSGISVLTPRDVGGGEAGTYKIRVTGNRVHYNETKIKWEKCGCYSDGNGIIIDTLKGDADHPAYKGRVLVANNLSYDNGGSGIHSYKSQHVDIVHNTAFANGRSTRMDSYANIFAHDSTDVRLLNNIAHGRPGQATNSTSRNVDVTYDYNIYFGGKAPEVRGANDVVADPKLVRTGTGADADFRLSEGSPAAGSGTPFAAVTTDFTGARRALGTPDRGAYGFGAKSSGVPGHASDASSPGQQGDAPAGSGQSAGSDPTASPGGQAGNGTQGIAGPKPHSASGPLAETGGSHPALPLGIAAVVLALGGGLLYAARRKRP